MKTIKVRTDFVPDDVDYLTPGKVYEAYPLEDWPNLYRITSDRGSRPTIRPAGCAHLDLRSWEVVDDEAMPRQVSDAEEALLRNLTDQELVRYAGQYLPPELYSRLVTLFDEQADLEQQLEQQEQDANECESELEREIDELHAEIRALEPDILEAEQ